MRKEEKRLILILVLITVVVIGVVWAITNNNKKKQENNTNVVQEENKTEEYVQKLEDGSKLNVSDELQKSKKIDGLEITNIQLREIGGITTLLADVSNKTGSATNDKMVKVEVLDKSGNTIVTLRGLIDAMPADGSVQLNMAVTADVANAYDFKISNDQ